MSVLTKKKYKFAKVDQSLIGKLVRCHPVGEDASPDWWYTEGIVKRIDESRFNESLTLLITKSEHYPDYIHTETDFPLNGDWGYVIIVQDWDN